MIDSIELARFIRLKSIEMCSEGRSSHIGSVLSCADILAVLYSRILKFKADEPLYELRDRFLLSKGHAGAGLYATLAKLGFVNEEILIDGLRLVGDYLEKSILRPNNINYPLSRLRFLNTFK